MPMTSIHRIHSLGLLASLCAAPLLAGCPGGGGDEGGEQTSSTAGSSEGVAETGTGTSASTSGPATGTGTGTTTVGDGTSESSTGPAGECTEEECGPAPGAPNFLCQDGVTWGGPGPCERGPDGTCGWTFVECPPCCYAAEQPGDCIEGSSCCADGTWACNDDGGNPTCDTAAVCMCCQPGEEPDCIEGASCCAGGEWQCNDDGGNPTCQELGATCELRPPPECQGMGETCAGGETCCAGFECCEGVPVPPGMEYCSNNCPISDRNRKENFSAVDGEAILAKLVELPVTTWNYTFDEPSIRHIGPMAQDFAAAFEVGATDTMIFQLDADGVAFASIQALHGEVQALRSEKAALEEQLARLEARLDRVERRAR